MVLYEAGLMDVILYHYYSVRIYVRTLLVRDTCELVQKSQPIKEQTGEATPPPCRQQHRIDQPS